MAIEPGRCGVAALVSRAHRRGRGRRGHAWDSPEMHVALTSAGGQVVDRRGWNEQSGTGPDVLGDPTALVARWLIEGEGPALEFKQELKAESAKVSFAETVAAFANGAGGTMLIGIRDDSEVVGYRPAKVADQITSIARDRVVEPIDVQISEVERDGTYVQVVTVPAGDADRKPYRAGGRVMIRANGTTREATTFEIRSLVASADAARGAPYLGG